MGIGSILGGIAGLLIPGGGAIASALGSGIGTLLEGGSGKDAIKNALLAGGTSAMFPGVASAIQQSAMGKAATGMFGGMGIGTQAGLTALQSNAAPAALNAASSGTGIAGAFSKMGPISKAYAGLSLGSMFVPKEKVGPFNKPEGYGGVIDSSNFLKGLYVSRFTGKHYDSSEARDLADQYAEEKAKEEVPSDYTAVAPVEYSMGTPVGFAMGGRIQGPGSGTSDSIPARIYQDGRPVSEARLSNNEVVLSHRDLAELDPNGDSDRAAETLGQASSGDRGQMAAKMYANVRNFRAGTA
jgi:hypothetical protein